eukprot:CAMPEP_0201592356 /NCGR_PEP_ID=MMETSP0190_2-20130828/190276_1 /ASSEMBLY_ACC=CAM_ASM_000263 /TAXON_ID=37353 /ORGANISM="Rosalina sp." /LENGTH=350 /DNA_ID=CAMNT_0048051093 /DNA_START=45 /DNA_END=1097 /DNA_ORIENTATION=-
MAMQKADKFMLAADKKAQKFDWFGISKQQNQEDAAEMYAKAAAQYKIIKEYGKAGLCYSKSAQCNMAAQNDIEAKASWREAGKCYRHVDFQKAIDAYKNAIQLNLDADRFGQAARLQEEIGDMLAEDDHLDEAIEAYEQSADYYEAENDTGNKNKRLLKVAHMCGKAKKWEKAIKIFENTAKASADNNLLRWKVKEYIFKAMLLNICMLAEDDIVKKKNIKWPQAGKTINERYCDISDIYASSRECKLIIQLLDCLPTEIQEFKDAIASYDRICKLETWNFELVYFIEKYMEDKQHEAPDLDVGFGGDDGGDGGYGDNDEQKEETAPTQKHNPFDQQVSQQDLADAPDLL